MKIFSVILNEHIDWEYDKRDTLFQSEDINKAISFAKELIYNQVIQHEEDINMLAYSNLSNSKGYFFSTNDSSYFKQVYIIETVLNEPLKTPEKIVWELTEKVVFEMFSKDLDFIFKNDSVPCLSFVEKQHLFDKFKKDNRVLSIKSNFYIPERLNAADIFAMTEDNINSLFLYEKFEAIYH